MLRRDLVLGFSIFASCCVAVAQQSNRAVQGRPATTLMQASGVNPGLQNTSANSNRLVTSAMSHLLVISPTGVMPGGTAANSAIVAVLRKQSMAAQSMLVPAVRPVSNNNTGPLLNGGTAQMLNPPASASSPQIGASQIMNSPGSGGGVSNGRTVPPTMQQAPSAVAQAHPQQPQKPGSHVIPTQACMVGIGGVDGQKSGVWFSPVPGPDGTFLIQGCGFGTIPGAVYLTGVQAAPTSVINPGNQNFQGQVTFQVAPNQWSDRQIVAQIDPNASGLYDTNNVTLVVKTAGGQLYQATGFNFSAARADQVLSGILKAPSCWTSQNGCIPAGINLALVNSASGQVQADAESPSVSLIQPGETIAVSRQSLAGQFPIPAAPGLSFAGATDTYQFHFAAGFQLDPHTGVQLRHTTFDSSYCQSVNGVPTTNGNWNVNYTSTTSFQVFWAEEGCWPATQMSSGSTQQWMNYGSVSAYALQITVVGPRGVSPWPSGNTNSLTIKQGTQRPLLLGH